MVTRGPWVGRRTAGYLIADAVVAMAIVMVALVPLTLALGREGVLARRYYQRAIAEQIADGELEVLQAGGWRRLGSGEERLEPRARSAVNLPPGGFWVTLTNDRVRVEWRSGDARTKLRVVREGRVR
jgi:hypothetical protein